MARNRPPCRKSWLPCSLGGWPDSFKIRSPQGGVGSSPSSGIYTSRTSYSKRSVLTGSHIMKCARWFVGAIVVAVVLSMFGVGGQTQSVADERGMTFEIYKDRKEEFRWRLKAANGNIMATSGEGYKAKEDCKKGIEAIQKGAAAAKVEDITTK